MSTPKKTDECLWTDFPIRKEILKSLAENKIHKPLPIQVKTLRATLVRDKHVLGAARTGSGKTLAYAIPMLNRILTYQDSPCSDLKGQICNDLEENEDFEFADGEMSAIEDMIVDKLPNSTNNGSRITLEQKVHTCPEAVVLVPTRELASQVKEEIDKICSNTAIRTCCLIGGLSQEKQLRVLSKHKPQVIIATPGRLYDIVQSDSIEHLNIQSIASIRTLIIDEADRMMQKGHFQEVIKIIDIVKESSKFRRENFTFRVYLFSATLTFLHELPERLNAKPATKVKSTITKSRRGRDKEPFNPKEHNKKNKIKRLLALLGIDRAETRVIDLNDQASFGRPSSEQLTELKVSCLAQEKDLYLYYFLIQNQKKRTLIFCNSKDCLRRLANVLKFLGIDTLKLYADMDQKQRLSSLEKFRQRPNSVLVATDVAARGLDIKDLDCVVHYQVPKTCESYIHRSGRTARLSEKGVSLTICEPKEAPFYRRLCNTINAGKDLDDYDIDINLKSLLKDRVILAQQCDKIDHSIREKKSDRDWFMKAAKECDIELDEDELRHLNGRGKSRQENLEEDASKRRRLNLVKKQLDSLLKKPLITRKLAVKQSRTSF